MDYEILDSIPSGLVDSTVGLQNLFHHHYSITSAQVVGTAPKSCPDFSFESIFAGILYLENHFISSLNDYCKRKETPQNGKLESFRLVWLLFRPSRITWPRLHSNLKLMCCRTPARRGPQYLHQRLGVILITSSRWRSLNRAAVRAWRNETQQLYSHEDSCKTKYRIRRRIRHRIWYTKYYIVNDIVYDIV